MSRKGSGFGIVLLVVTMVVVLLLVARHWKSVAPTAVQIQQTDEGLNVGPAESAGAGQLGPGALPDLNEMRRQTSGYNQQVQDALQQIEDQDR